LCPRVDEEIAQHRVEIGLDRVQLGGGDGHGMAEIVADDELAAERGVVYLRERRG
jgi:hypothetical protein